MRHCEPVRKLAWQSVPQNVLISYKVLEKLELLGVRIPTVASRPRNDIDFFDTLNMGLTKVSPMFFCRPDTPESSSAASFCRIPQQTKCFQAKSAYAKTERSRGFGYRFCGRLFFVFTGDPADERHPWQLRRTSMTIRGMQNSWKRNNPIHLFSHDVAEVCAARFPVAFYPSISDCVSPHREYRQLIAF